MQTIDKQLFALINRGAVSDTLSLILLIVLSTQYQGINFNTLYSRYFSGYQKFNSKL